MKVGKLRHQILLQFQKEEQDPQTGVLTHSWADLATVWASVEPLSAREFVASQATQARVTVRITIRYRDDVVPTLRIIHRGKIYNVEGVLADRESGLEYLTLPCSEVGPVPSDVPAEDQPTVQALWNEYGPAAPRVLDRVEQFANNDTGALSHEG